MSVRATIRAELAALPPGAGPFDAHAHTGADVDGTTRTCERHLRELAQIGGRSVIFPLHVEGGYAAENRRVIEECRAAPAQLVPFARLDPKTGSTGAEAVEALAAGARGFKLHPRSEDFRLDHPGVEAILAVAAEARVPVLIHAGLGVGRLGETLLWLAERHRSCPLILAHAAVSDLSRLWEEVPAHPNLYFDAAWWNPSDLLALYALVPPGRILYGSDVPFMDMELVLAINLRCARHAGLPPEAIELVAGGQLDALLAGEEPHDAGPAPGPPPATPSLTTARFATALSATGGAYLGGGDPAQMLELAGLALGEDGEAFGGVGPLLVELLDEAVAGGPDAPWAVAMALTLVATPGVESAALAA